MTNLTITDIPTNVFKKNEYSAEELLKVLLQNMNYNLEIENFSKEQNKELLSSSNWNYFKISNSPYGK